MDCQQSVDAHTAGTRREISGQVGSLSGLGRAPSFSRPAPSVAPRPATVAPATPVNQDVSSAPSKAAVVSPLARTASVASTDDAEEERKEQLRQEDEHRAWLAEKARKELEVDVYVFIFYFR